MSKIGENIHVNWQSAKQWGFTDGKRFEQVNDFKIIRSWLAQKTIAWLVKRDKLFLKYFSEPHESLKFKSSGKAEAYKRSEETKFN